MSKDPDIPERFQGDRCVLVESRGDKVFTPLLVSGDRPPRAQFPEIARINGLSDEAVRKIQRIITIIVSGRTTTIPELTREYLLKALQSEGN
jgi:hypothetical protein